MSAKMRFTETTHVPKALTTFAVSLVFFLAALPAHAQQDQYRVVWIGHPVVIIVGLILVLLAAIGAAAIFVWLVRWAAATHFMTRVFAAATPPSTSLKSALLGVRLTRPSTKRNAS